MEIKIPNLNSVKETLNWIYELNNLDISKIKEIRFKFSVDWITPLPTLLCISSIKRFKKDNPQIKTSICVNYDDKATDYAAHIGFFKSISDSIEFGNAPGEAKGSEKYIPITSLDFNAIHQAEIEKGNFEELNDSIESESKRLAKVLCQYNITLNKLFTYIFREILRNVPEHANINTAMIFAQYWKNGNAEIAIIDNGIGLKQSFAQNPVHKKYILDDETALDAAVQPGISQAFIPSTKNKSTDTWSNSGFGLYMASEICKELHGDFWIISGSKAMNLSVGLDAVFYDTNFNGTAIGLSFCTNDLKDAQKLISNISKRGEEKAKSIRNAFKKASEPSKSLFVR